MAELTELQVEEISLVPRPANRRKFLLFKGDEDPDRPLWSAVTDEDARRLALAKRGAGAHDDGAIQRADDSEEAVTMSELAKQDRRTLLAAHRRKVEDRLAKSADPAAEVDLLSPRDYELYSQACVEGIEPEGGSPEQRREAAVAKEATAHADRLGLPHLPACDEALELARALVEQVGVSKGADGKLVELSLDDALREVMERDAKRGGSLYRRYSAETYAR